jgi:hypothetical protein
MKPIDIAEIMSFEQWDRVRPILRPLFIHEKARRRLAVGEHLTLLFENAQSVWYQIQEMLRVERIEDGDAVTHELETYNELIPREDELSATMLIEYTDAKERDLALKGLVGLDRHLRLVADGRAVNAIFAGTQIAEDAVSSVQFVRFPLPRGLGASFIDLAQKGALRIEVDHPMLAARVPIDAALAQALHEDLSAP